jgi:uncharacterized protein YcgI (DUF1989 family)
VNTHTASTPIKQYHIDPQSGIAFTVKQGQVLRVIDVAGEQVADLICFAEEGIEESLSAGHTTDYNGKLFFSKDDILYSNRSNPMLKIVADKVGKHVMLYAPCSQEMFARSYGATESHPNCLDNLVNNFKSYGIRAYQITIPLNIFLNIDISNEGKIEIHPPLSRAGDHIDLQAEMDLIVGVTACSAGLCNNYHCTPIDIEIYAGDAQV